MAIDTSDLAAKLQAEYERKKQADAQRDTAPSFEGYTSEDKLVMSLGYTVCRVVSLPKLCGVSYIKCDDDRTHMFKFPTDGNSVVLRAAARVLEKKYAGRDAANKAVWNLPVKDANPDLYQMVYNNESITEGQYGPNGWAKWLKGPDGRYTAMPSSTVALVNVINRSPFSYKVAKKDANGADIEEEVSCAADWCVTNKHSLLLAKAAKGFGCAMTIYNLLMDQIFPNYGNFSEFDISINRLKADPYYQIFKADTLTNNKDVFPFVKQGKLTAEESAIELYDLDELSQPTPASVIYSLLKGKISKIDEYFNTHFLTEIERAVDAEPKSEANTAVPAAVQRETPAPASQPVTAPAAKASATTPAPRTRVAAPKAEAPAGESVSVWDKAKAITAKDKDGTYFIDKLTKDKASLISGVHPNGKELIFTSSDDELSACPECTKAQPSIIDDYCIYCGVKFS